MKHLFAIILNIICTLGFLFTMTKAIIGTDPYINMLWVFISIVLFCSILYLNEKFVDKLTK